MASTATNDDHAVTVSFRAADGAFGMELVALATAKLNWANRRLVSVSDALSQLTNLNDLSVQGSAFVELPAAVFGLAQLQQLWAFRNRLTTLSPLVGQLCQLTILNLDHNALTTLPRSISRCVSLQFLSVDSNKLVCLPGELDRCRALRRLSVEGNCLTWLPWLFNVHSSRQQGEAKLHVFADRNEVPSRELLAPVSTTFAAMRFAATEVCFALQELALPALLTLEIIDALLPNDVAMHVLWRLATTVKHYRDRQA
jgi:Leucine-rich repeat (LRR) protein